MLECGVPASEAILELEFYAALRQLDTSKPETLQALAFARTWTDLAQRVLIADAVQKSLDAELPPALGLPALKAYHSFGPAFTAEQFLSQVPSFWRNRDAQLLADLAQWMSQLFNPLEPATSSIQVWCSGEGELKTRLYGRPGLPNPPCHFQLLQRHPLAAWLAANPHRPVAVIAHYDVHGLAMLALTLRFLRLHGISNIDVIYSFELTGDIGKLWKRTLPQALTSEKSYSAVVMIDCSVDSRRPARTLKALQKLDPLAQLKLILLDHHQDTFTLAPQLIRPNLELVLTDVLSCGLVETVQPIDHDLMALGAVGDKVPEVAHIYSVQKHPALHQANAVFHRRMIQFSPTPKEMLANNTQPLQALWEELSQAAAVAPNLAESELGEAPALEQPPVPAFVICGALLIITERINAVGRTWYALLEKLMEEQEVPYAAAARILDDKRANVLLLTRWLSVEMPPIRFFIPERFLAHCLGHPAAQWVDLDKNRALELLSEVAERINVFTGTAADFEQAAFQLEANLLAAKPLTAQPPGPNEHELPPPPSTSL